MAKISDIAKEEIFNALKERFPEGQIVDKKFYVNINVSGETAQIAVSLTAPKTPIEISAMNIEDAKSVSMKNTFDVKEIENTVDDIFDFFKL